MDKNVRNIGFYPYEGGFATNDVSIKDAIKRKASRYGNLDKPFIIAINATGTIGVDDYEVMNALFGSLAIEYNVNSEFRDERNVRMRDGIFMGPNGPQHTRVSAILITNINPANTASATYRLIKHPFAQFPVDLTETSLEFEYVENNKLIKREGLPIEKILAL